MDRNTNYYLVDVSVLPEVFSKVIEVKELLAKGDVKAINDAVEMVGISRSAYYKYKDFIFPFYDLSHGKVMTLLFTVEHISGILSEILNKIAEAKANILSINQNLPVNGVANITISIETRNMGVDIKELINEISSIDGVKNHEILAES